MTIFKQPLQLLLLWILLLLLVACQSSLTDETPILPPGNNQAGINSYANDLPNWEIPRNENIDKRELFTGATTEGDTTYDCTVSTESLDPTTTTYQDIMLAGLDADVLYPGALLQGDQIQQGLLRSVRLDRAPITLTISLSIDDPSITVPVPNTGTMVDAVSELKRRADTRLGAIDVVPGNIFFNRVESHSYEQSLNEVGVSAGYDDKIATRVNASFNFGSDRKATSHTITVYLVEPLFKISFSEDTLRTPADLFASTVSKADLLVEESQGRMGADNLPVYVKTITYGRILMYTLTSTEVDSFQRLAAAVSGSYGAFSGGGSYSQEDRNILSNSQETLIAFGGSQEASKAAILDLEKFFVPIEATQAVPISYEIRDIKGNVARVGDITEYQVQTCTPRDTVVQKRVTVTVDKITSTSSCDTFSAGNEIRGTVNAFGRRVANISKNLESGQSSDLGDSISQTFNQPTTSTSFTISGSFHEADDGLEGGNDIIGDFSQTLSYPWSNRSYTKDLSGDGCSIKLDYSVRVVDL